MWHVLKNSNRDDKTQLHFTISLSKLTILTKKRITVSPSEIRSLYSEKLIID